MSGPSESIYIGDRVGRDRVQVAAEGILSDRLESVRTSAFPSYIAVDYRSEAVNEGALLDEFEAALGARPLTLEQVESLYDARTGEPLDR